MWEEVEQLRTVLKQHRARYPVALEQYGVFHLVSIVRCLDPLVWFSYFFVTLIWSGLRPDPLLGPEAPLGLEAWAD